MTVIEPYALPPALAAAVVGAILVARGQKVAVGLYATGLAAAVASSLVVLAIGGSGVRMRCSRGGRSACWPGRRSCWRSGPLIKGGSEEKPNRFLPLRRPTLVIAIAAAASGAIQGIRYGSGVEDLPSFLDPTYVMLTVLAFALVATALAAGAGRVAVTGPGAREVPVRWWFLAAAVYLVAGPMSAISPTALDTWTVWSLMMLLLGLLVVTALRARTRAVTLPPVWFTFALAWSTGVAGWSQRDYIRLEGWSIPMGVALLAAGVIAMPKLAEQFGRVNLNSWPIGFRGSWRLLSPGILVLILLPSIIATTFTDAATVARHPRHRARARLRARRRVPPAARALHPGAHRAAARDRRRVRRSRSAAASSRSRGGSRSPRRAPCCSRSRCARSVAPARTRRPAHGSATWSSRVTHPGHAARA